MNPEMLTRLLCGEDGQDLIEYALLTATIGLVGGAAWALMSDNIQTVYTGWDAGVNDLWEPADPE